jgi:hypothetical protein
MMARQKRQIEIGETENHQIDLASAPHPPAHQQARHHQRHHANFPTPSSEEFLHDSVQLWDNGFRGFLGIRLAGVGEQEGGGEGGQWDDDEPVGDSPDIQMCVLVEIRD